MTEVSGQEETTEYVTHNMHHHQQRSSYNLQLQILSKKHSAGANPNLLTTSTIQQ